MRKTHEANCMIKGKTVRRVRYLTLDESNALGSDTVCPMAIDFTDGSHVILYDRKVVRESGQSVPQSRLETPGERHFAPLPPRCERVSNLIPFSE